MKDLLGIEVRKNDVVAYVYPNKQGKQESIMGVVVGFNNKGAILDTQNGKINVKNIIKIKSQSYMLNLLRKINILHI